MEEAEELSSTKENETTTHLGLNYHPTLLDGDVFMGVAGVSHTRDALLEIICELDMRHPHNNLRRNANFISRDGTIIDSEYISPISFNLIFVIHFHSLLVSSSSHIFGIES